jgi:opacity protein-like surface antigen
MSTMCRQIWRTKLATSLFVAGVLAVPAVAHADDGKKDCEPGSWFCGETQTQNGKDLQPLPAEKPDAKPEGKTAPPVVVYQPPPPTVVVQARDAPPPYYYVPRKAPPKKEWGLNLHIGGAMMGKGRDDNAGMLMTGVGLRFRPLPQAALEGVLDFAGGRDYNGYQRRETAFTLNGLVFLNPKNTTQVYLLGGFGWQWAWANDDRPGSTGGKFSYDYFGVQAGVGLEFRLSKAVALNVDLRGLIRGRIDDGRRYNPEFVSADRRSTNTSGAGLLTGGITFYW